MLNLFSKLKQEFCLFEKLHQQNTNVSKDLAPKGVMAFL